MKRQAVLVLVTACAHPVSDSHQSSPLIEAGEIDGHFHVRTPNYTMVFGAEGTVRLPESLQVGTHANVLGMDICPLESLMGANIYPGGTAIGGQALAGGTSTTSAMDFTGPLLARVTVDYSVPYSCGGMQHLSGSQTLTFFPDGRITRRDVVTSSDSALPATTACGCANIAAPDFFFTLFYAFSNDARIVDENDNDTQASGRIEACAQWSDLTIGLHWSDTATNTRISPNARPSFVLDMMTSSAAPFGPIVNSTHSSTMMIASGSPRPSCAATLEQIPQPILTIDGSAVPTDEYGIYVDSRNHDTAFTISAERAVPPFVVSLELGDHAKITSNIAHSDGWYATQNNDKTSPAFIWFATGLAAGETITVEPL